MKKSTLIFFVIVWIMPLHASHNRRGIDEASGVFRLNPGDTYNVLIYPPNMAEGSSADLSWQQVFKTGVQQGALQGTAAVVAAAYKAYQTFIAEEDNGDEYTEVDVFGDVVDNTDNN